MNSKKILVTVKEYAILTLGIFLYVLGWNLFLIPHNLIGGGVTGMASIVQYATHGVIKIGYTYFVVNVGLLIAALFTLGKGFGGKTVYAILLASVGLSALQGVIPQPIINDLAVANGPLMSTIMGGLMAGVGIGLSISQGGSTGGTDIVALIVNKYRNVSPGRMILAVDVVIILSSLLVPSFTKDGEVVPMVGKITTVVYGFILVMVTSVVTDMIISGSRQSVQLFILSSKSEQIAEMITKELHRGVTVLNGKGWYTQKDMEVLMVLTRKTDLNILLRNIKAIDSDAFLSVASVTGVYGKGFDTFKTRRKKKS